METTTAIRALAALAQESRLAVYRLLVAAGPEGRSAGAIADALGIAPATLSFHLSQLANAGLLKARQESRFIYYSADFPVMNELVGFLTENCCGGNPCGPAVAKPIRIRKGVKA
jgi:DNA-binding transcriptional ArsR family regulator